MKFITLSNLEFAPWYALLIYWALSALRLKRIKVSEDPASRLWHIGIMVLAFMLLYSDRLALGPLGWRFAPQSALVWAPGILLTYVGAGLAIWARYSLGQYWSGRVTLKEDHQLIRVGPYAYVRHPIYSGLLLAMGGTALVVGEWRALVGVLLALFELSRKAAKEEALLATEFGDQYGEYRRQAGFLTPRFR
ncbi:MAG TPA: isoprenylcysteine carboxylmethyltransferase family protein [Terriglobales bacterium]|nr:isoprenylcysteine carboxylmethyltransferase family protein [Terriglobales bacterium]